VAGPGRPPPPPPPHFLIKASSQQEAWHSSVRQDLAWPFYVT